MKRVQGLDIPQPLEGQLAGDAVFTDSEAFCRALQHKRG
jgi:hypothetical protein